MFKREIVSIEQLIATPFVKVEEHSFTVKEILDFCAYVRGGVHDDEPSPKQAVLFDNSMFSGHPDLMAAIHEIAIIILRGLRPLAIAVYEDLLKTQAAFTPATVPPG